MIYFSVVLLVQEMLVVVVGTVTLIVPACSVVRVARPVVHAESHVVQACSVYFVKGLEIHDDDMAMRRKSPFQFRECSRFVF